MAIDKVVLEDAEGGLLDVSVVGEDVFIGSGDAIKIKDLFSSIQLLQAAWYAEHPENVLPPLAPNVLPPLAPPAENGPGNGT